MGLTEPERDTDEHIVLRAEAGVFKSVVIRDGKVVGATLARRQQEAGFPAAGLRSWPAAAGRAELLFDLGGLPPTWSGRARR